jgi:hypothetical protein
MEPPLLEAAMTAAGSRSGCGVAALKGRQTETAL